MTWSVTKTPRFSTVTQRPVSGARPVSFSVSPYPSWEWELNWEILRDQGLAEENSASLLKPDLFALQDFFLAMNGANGRFVYDPAANDVALNVPLEDTFVTQNTSGTLVNGYSGTADGTETVFQLYRTSRITGSLMPAEPIDALSVITSSPLLSTSFALYGNGALIPAAHYTLSQYPLQVTFGTPPVSGTAISWFGYFAYVVKFSDDSLDLEQFMFNLWKCQSLKIEQVPLGW